jgi:hypothetical protein
MHASDRQQQKNFDFEFDVRFNFNSHSTLACLTRHSSVHVRNAHISSLCRRYGMCNLKIANSKKMRFSLRFSSFSLRFAFFEFWLKFFTFSIRSFPETFQTVLKMEANSRSKFPTQRRPFSKVVHGCVKNGQFGHVCRRKVSSKPVMDCILANGKKGRDGSGGETDIRGLCARCIRGPSIRNRLSRSKRWTANSGPADCILHKEGR